MRLNALASPMIADLIALFEALNNDRQTRVVILTEDGSYLERAKD